MATKTRREILKGLGAGIGTFGLISASGSTASAAQAKKSGRGFNWRRFAGTKISFWNDAHPFTQQVVPSRLHDFETLTGISVDWRVYPENAFRQNLPLALRSNPKSVDGYMTLTSWDGVAFSQAGWYEPLEKYIHNKTLTSPDYDISDFFRATLKIATVGGKLVAIPLYPEQQMLYYNVDLFHAAGVAPPSNITIDQFVKLASRLHDSSGNVAGYVSRGNDQQAVYTLAPFVFAEGGSWLDKHGQPALDSKKFIKALDVYGTTLRKYGPPGIAGMTYPVEETVFDQGHAAMLTDSSLFVSTFEDPSQSNVAGKVGYAPLPKGPAGVHTTLISWAEAINSQSANKGATWYLIQWLTNKEMAKAMGEAKIPVARQSAWNGAFSQFVPAQWSKVYQEQLATAAVNQANPLVAQVPAVRDAIGKDIVAVINGTPADSAARQAQTAVKPLIGPPR